MDEKKPDLKHDSHRDPISGEPGAHPAGVGVGTAVGGAIGGGVAAAAVAAGASAGSLAGPVGTALGTAVGVAVGGIIGAAAGKEVAEKINPTAEDAYWRENYASRPYAEQGAAYEVFRPAYRYGWEARYRFEGRQFEDVETELERDWQRQNPDLAWDRARPAVRDGWDHIAEQTAVMPVPPPPVP